MQNFLIIVVGVLLVNAIVLYSGGFEYIQRQFEPEPQEPFVQADVIDTFKNTLETKVIEELGQPIEGFEPSMFLATFPGLAESDFDGVEASIGSYLLVDGQLEHQLGNTELVHSAAGAIGRRGIETLYRNIATRVGVDIENGGTLTDIMGAITGE